ncbi:hypothetical protein B0J14DRAFT_564485 [Halenospora varia]|nr:hypothetical protein B0J14DRAFT_564485 [Halenospora varia]
MVFPRLTGASKTILSEASPRRQLESVSEITQDFSMEPRDVDINDAGAIHIDLILGSCAGLLHLESSTDDETNKSRGNSDKLLHFVHCTVQEYMIQMQADLFAGADSDMANTCMQYLSIGIWDDLVTLLGYAAHFWVVHVARVANLDSNMVLKVYSRHARSFFAHAVASIHGATNVLSLLLASNLPLNAEVKGWTPLSIAAAYDQTQCIAMLLAAGARACARTVCRSIVSINDAGWSNEQFMAYLLAMPVITALKLNRIYEMETQYENRDPTWVQASQERPICGGYFEEWKPGRPLFYEYSIQGEQ